MIHLFDKMVEQGSGANAFIVLPILRHIPFDPFGFRKFGSVLNGIRSTVLKLVGGVRDNGDKDNFITAYVDEMKKAEKLGESTYLDEANLLGCIEKLFAAGTETTSTTILWSLLYVLHNPETQKKIFNEIMEHVGTTYV